MQEVGRKNILVELADAQRAAERDAALKVARRERLALLRMAGALWRELADERDRSAERIGVSASTRCFDAGRNVGPVRDAAVQLCARGIASDLELEAGERLGHRLPRLDSGVMVELDRMRVEAFVRERDVTACRMSVDGQPIASPLVEESGPADVLLLSSVYGQTVTLDIDGVKHVIECKTMRIMSIDYKPPPA